MKDRCAQFFICMYMMKAALPDAFDASTTRQGRRRYCSPAAAPTGKVRPFVRVQDDCTGADVGFTIRKRQSWTVPAQFTRATFRSTPLYWQVANPERHLIKMRKLCLKA